MTKRGWPFNCFVDLESRRVNAPHLPMSVAEEADCWVCMWEYMCVCVWDGEMMHQLKAVRISQLNVLLLQHACLLSAIFLGSLMASADLDQFITTIVHKSWNTLSNNLWPPPSIKFLLGTQKRTRISEQMKQRGPTQHQTTTTINNQTIFNLTN